MTIKELKNSLSRFPADMDDISVLLTYVPEGQTITEYDYLAFVSYTDPKKENEETVIILGSYAAAVERQKRGKLKFSDGSKPSNSDLGINDGE